MDLDELNRILASCLARGDLEHAAIAEAEIAAAQHGPVATIKPTPAQMRRFERVAREHVWDRSTGMAVRSVRVPTVIRRPRQSCGPRRRPGHRVARARAPAASDSEGEPHPRGYPRRSRTLRRRGRLRAVGPNWVVIA